MSDLGLTSSQRLEAANERAARVARLKVEYQKVYNNPFRTNSSIFDPAVMRYEAARAYSKDFYKYTPRSLLFPAGMFAAVVLLQYVINKENTAKEDNIRTGGSTYYERAKFASKGLY